MTTVFTIMSYGGMILAVICLVLAVILFIRWDIPKIFGDMTGHTERKALERMRKEGYVGDHWKRNIFPSVTGTGKIRVRKSDDSTEVSSAENGTAAVEKSSAEDETVVLEATSVEDETVILETASTEEEATAVLAESPIEGVIYIRDENITSPGTVEKVLDFVMVHTDHSIA